MSYAPHQISVFPVDGTRMAAQTLEVEVRDYPDENRCTLHLTIHGLETIYYFHDCTANRALRRMYNATVHLLYLLGESGESRAESSFQTITPALKGDGNDPGARR